MTKTNTTELFPEVGMDDETILDGLKGMCKDDLVSDGHAFAFIYDAGKEVNELARKAFAASMGANGLDPTVYPSARRLENDLVAIAMEHLRVPEGGCGTITTGGTESVMLAVKTAREHSRKTKPHITQPNMVIPETAHACFQKGAHYLGIELRLCNVNPETMEADVEDMRSKVDENTILVAGSAPSYAHGVIDPISEIAALAQEKDILCHVDACIGGWVLPFQRELGVELPDFDFIVPGVTSMSVDLHKYGFTPKGCSVLLQRRRELRDSQYYTCATWTGYSIINSTMLGSKSVAPMGAAWSVMKKLGREGYKKLIGHTWQATEKLVKGIDETPGVKVLGTPRMGLVAMVTLGGDIFELADRLTAKGWHVQPTYAYGNSPAHIHLSVDPQNASRMKEFLASLAECVVDLPDTVEPPAAVIQMLEMVAKSGGQGINMGSMMGEFGISDGQLPTEQATLHRLLNGVSPEAREALLVLFFGEMFNGQ